MLNVRTDIDTSFSPRKQMWVKSIDSLTVIRQAYESELPRMKHERDSLQAELNALRATIDSLQKVFESKDAYLDSLVAWKETLIDSIDMLDILVAARTDSLYRLRHPEEFLRKNALFTGEGVYPRRDEMPKRSRESAGARER